MGLLRKLRQHVKAPASVATPLQPPGTPRSSTRPTQSPTPTPPPALSAPASRSAPIPPAAALSSPRSAPATAPAAGSSNPPVSLRKPAPAPPAQPAQPEPVASSAQADQATPPDPDVPKRSGSFPSSDEEWRSIEEVHSAASAQDLQPSPSTSTGVSAPAPVVQAQPLPTPEEKLPGVILEERKHPSPPASLPIDESVSHGGFIDSLPLGGAQPRTEAEPPTQADEALSTPSEDQRQLGVPEPPKLDTTASLPRAESYQLGLEPSSQSLRPLASQGGNNLTAPHPSGSLGRTTPSSTVTNSTVPTQFSGALPAAATTEDFASLLQFEFGPGSTRDLAASLSVPRSSAGARLAPPARGARTVPRPLRAQFRAPPSLSPRPVVAASAPQLAEIPTVQPLEELLGTWTSS